jgi:hypothetical protein
VSGQSDCPGSQRELLRRMRKLGWRVEITKRQHVRLISPGGAVHISPGTGSDRRGLRNTWAGIKRIIAAEQAAN